MQPTEMQSGDNEYDAYRKRMMLAYRFRPNPLVRAISPQANWPIYLKKKKISLLVFQNNPRRAYY